MTREEIITFYDKKVIKGKSRNEAFLETVDFLLDEINSRICKNCKYYGSDNFKRRPCLNKDLKDNILNLFFIPINENFGCNRFERKENGNI